VIQKVKIRNFQCHEKKNILLQSGRIITGTSNSGKSAIIRALYWVCCNKPRGDSFVTHGQKNCQVAIEGDGFTLTRKRHGKTNQYLLDGEVYETIGNEIPEIIQNALGINPEITFQLQHDAPFLLSKSPNEIGAFVSSLAKLNQMHDCLFALKKKMQEGQDKFRILEIERGREIEAGGQAKKVLKISDTLDMCLGYDHKLNQNAETMQKLDGLLKAIVFTKEDPVLSFPFEEIITTVEKQAKLHKDLENKKQITRRLESVTQEYVRISNLIDPFPMDYTEDLESADKMLKEQNALNSIVTKWDSIRKTVAEYTDKILDLKTTLQGKVCPLCQSQLQ